MLSYRTGIGVTSISKSLTGFQMFNGNSLKILACHSPNAYACLGTSVKAAEFKGSAVDMCETILTVAAWTQ